MTNLTHETLSRFDAYRIERELASGNMATVYVAQDDGTRQQVALKVAREASIESFEPLRREANLLARIRIDGISRLLDVGEHNGVPWYAMEFVDGTSLADLWREPGAFAQLDRWLNVFARLCRPLMELHSEGIVHRDIKPRNIVIAAGDKPVIVDFGLSLAYAVTSGRDLVAADPAFVGTVAYMSPEQLDGTTHDSRSDIYSLGCLLYEALAGRPPFTGSTQEAIQRRLDSEYTPLSEVVSVPDWLDELVDGMLQKDMSRRIAYLSDVADVLSLHGYGTSAAERHIKPNLYRPRLTGRGDVLGQVRDAVKRARRGDAACLLVGGESGIGKSRLVNEAGRIAANQKFAIVASSCLALNVSARGHGGSPLYPLGELLRVMSDHCVAGGKEVVTRIFGEHAWLLEPYERRLGFLPGIRSRLAPENVSERVAGDRTLAALTSALKAYSQDKPVLLAIDDLQWADEMTLEWLSSLGDSFFREARVVIMVTYRSDEVSQAISRLRSARHVQPISLSRLDGVSVSRMMEDILATRTNLPRELVRKVQQDSEGIPFFVYEYLRAALEGGYLVRHRGQWEYSELVRSTDPEDGALPMPSTVRDLLSRRVRSAGEDAFRLAQVAALVGRKFSVEDLVAMTAGSRGQVLDGILQLERFEIVESFGDAHQFIHDRIREVAYSELTTDDARGLHRRRAEILERGTSTDARASLAAELAYHWLEAGDDARGMEYLLQGGEHAARRGAHGDACRLLSRALDVDTRMKGGLSPLQRGRILQLLGLAAFNTSKLSDSIRYSADALRCLDQPMPEDRRSWSLYFARELVKLAKGTGGRDRERPPYEAVAAREQLALSLLYQGDNLEGVGHLIGALNDANEIEAPELTIAPGVRLAFLARTMRLKGFAQKMFDRANETAMSNNLPAGRGLSLYMEAEMHMGLGEWPECQSKAMKSAELFTQLGDPQEAEMAWAIASNGLHYAGAPDKAADLAGMILRSAEDRNHGIHMAWGLTMSVRSRLTRGVSEPDAEDLLRARDYIVTEPDLLSLVMTEGSLIRVLARLEKWNQAEHYTELLMSRLFSSRKPMVPQCIDGYEGLLDGAIGLWSRDPGNARLRSAAQRACRALKLFAMTFPMARPVYLGCRARLFEVEGRREKAIAWYRKAVASARELRTPCWEAEAHLGLAGIVEDAGVQSQHLQYAAAIRDGFVGERVIDSLD